MHSFRRSVDLAVILSENCEKGPKRGQIYRGGPGKSDSGISGMRA